ncbi:DUF6168 family protein [Aestuariibaculum sp. YM273]|uniref:DUF6168 family protein n=1 Tax=Aestuariibaculum sp. YM273 TaxID=3070659 RepID=UPI0027DC2285|nr:DUF6168 family protein [Aestuariibaculum sp. YM273]WMI66607.1 DUF6168 family protein [Aestuariibaculum sp. YM273]
MIKRILLFTLVVVLLFAIALAIHQSILSQPLSFPLWQVYLFHSVASLVVYASIEGICSIMPNNAGYAYLAFMFLKIGLFLLIFKNAVFENDSLTQVERYALVLPLFLFLTTEAIAVGKLLNNK